MADAPPTPGDSLADAGLDAPPAAEEGLVRCRWLSPQPVITGAPGPAEEAAGVGGPYVVTYGDEVWLTAEQADDPATPAARWSDDWAPDPDVAALAAELPEA